MPIPSIFRTAQDSELNGLDRAGTCVLAALIVALTSALASPANASSRPNRPLPSPSDPPERLVHVVTRHEGNTTRFFVENNELSEVTMTFEMKLVNLKGDVGFPYTGTFPPGQLVEAFAVEPVTNGMKWEFDYTNYFKLGSNCARHDDSCLYELPYAPGAKYKVTQGYNGKFSHTGSNQYATDWQMPEGTLVLAARGGLIVRTKDDSDKGGSSMDYDRYNNYVLIRHDDGTLAHYCHLEKGGVLVKAGQRVETGDAIAHSGNTGFSSGPHLHFCVFKTKDGHQRVSLPVKFRTNEGSMTLVSGKTYRATETQTVLAAQPQTPTRGSTGGSVQ